MGQEFRTAGAGAVFNTGMSRTQVPRGKVKGLILMEHGKVLSPGVTAELLEAAFHADKPNRAYPIRLIDEYAPSGGEAQVSQQGYGSNKVTGYSAFSEAYTIDVPDGGLRANVLNAVGMAFDMYIVTEHNIIFGQRNDKGVLCGIPLAGIHVGGQGFDSSGQTANLVLTVLYKDVEKYWKNEGQEFCDFDAVSALTGIVCVDLVKVEANKYKIREHYGRLDVTNAYADLLTGTNASKVWNGVTGMAYTDGYLVGTPASGGGIVSLKAASVLQANGVIGIEQIDITSSNTPPNDGSDGGGEAPDPTA